MQEFLKNTIKKNISLTEKGNVANYIPELNKAKKNDLGICIINTDGKIFYEGQYEKKFTIQSISKILVLMLAIIDNGENYVFSKVGMEPSGDPFNSIKKLETSTQKKPYNPLINAGAIAVTSMIYGKDKKEKIQRILSFFKKISEDDSLDVNYKIYCGELETGNRNRALGYFLKSQEIIEGNVEDILEVYFKQCSIEVTVETLAKIGLFLARNGKNSLGEQIVSSKITRIIKTLMCTCGMYDESGEFAVKVGIPSKSGVGGGILSVVPNKMGIGIYGPSLNKYGNSIGGIGVLEDLSAEFDLNIF